MFCGRGVTEAERLAKSAASRDKYELAEDDNAAGADFTADWLYSYLYDPKLVVADSSMPRYAFLFKTQKIVGQPSPKALTLSEAYAPEAGYEIVPTARGEALVAYLLSLKDTYAYPETKNVYTPPAKPEGTVEEKKEGTQ